LLAISNSRNCRRAARVIAPSVRRSLRNTVRTARIVPEVPIATSQPPRNWLSDRLQFEPRGGLGVAHRLGAENTTRETGLGQTDATDMQALHGERLKSFADDELGAAAADVHHQTAASVVRLRARHALVDEARLFTAGDDVDGMTQSALGGHQERVGVVHASQGIGANGRHTTLRQPAQTLAETRQAVERALARPGREPIPGIEPTGQTHHLLQTVENMERTVARLRDNQMEAV
jgi:hypothetical protein